MNPSNHDNKTSLARMAALSAAMIAVALLACSSASTPADEATPSTASTPTDPSKPGASDPSEPGDDPPGSGSGSGSSSGGSGSGGASPAEPAECKPAEPSKECGVSPQCECPSGKTCDVVDAIGNARCVASGDTPMGHPCKATGDCAVGMTCVFGTCHPFCGAPGKACSQPGTGACTQVKTMDGDDIPNFAVCRIACEPHDPASCGGKTSAGTAVCHVDPEGDTECQSGGSQAEGATCTPEEQCGPGLACVTTQDGNTCKRWCRLGEKDCGPGGSCVGFSPEINVRGTAYGACS